LAVILLVEELMSIFRITLNMLESRQPTMILQKLEIVFEKL